MASELFSNSAAQATNKTLTVVDLLAAAANLAAAGQRDEVLELYKTWIQHNSDNPLVYAVYFNYGVVLVEASKLEEARAALGEAVRINPDFIPPYINLGLLLSRMGINNEAVVTWYQALNKLAAVNPDNLSYKATILKNVGRVFEESRLDQSAEDALRQSLELAADQRDVIEHWIILRQKQCKWPVIEPFRNVSRQHILKYISALSLASYSDDPLWQLANAAYYAKNSIGQPLETHIDSHQKLLNKAPGERLRIGYLSSDLREHAIGFLMAELFELHNREKVEVFAYYCGIPQSDSIKVRTKAAVEHWVDLTELGLSDEQAAQRMVDDKIDILVDVNGNTLSGRMRVMPMRPAPIIVNWLGFPGTTGSASHNYIIADDFIVPKESEIFYTEKVVRLPCYQPNDRKRAVSPKQPTRQEAGLPEAAMVYCSFNGTHKITPHVWRRWMSILQQVPGSVLWLLENVESVKAQLRELAKKHGVEPERLYFAPRMHVTDHLARYPLADLFLDSSPYGAHTTCSDSLWMGVPVITVPGRSFASRVCGSLVKSAGLDELVCTSGDHYVSLAVELGRNREKLLGIRRKLAANRDSCVLFNTPLLVSRLEALYAGMWRDFKNGELPRPNLANLDIYNDIGIALDRDDVEMLSVDNYLEIYRDKLAAWHRLSFMHPDGRLWAGEAKKAAVPSKQPEAAKKAKTRR